MREFFAIMAVVVTLVSLTAKIAVAEDFINCNLLNTNGDDNLEVNFIREDGTFYGVPSTGGEKVKLLVHVTSEEAMRTLAALKALTEAQGEESFPLEPKITLIERLEPGGANLTTIHIDTKKAWHSRHTALLSQYEGTCHTNMF